MRPSVVEGLQENLTASLEHLRTPNNNLDKVSVFLNQFQPFGAHLYRYYQNMKDDHAAGKLELTEEKAKEAEAYAGLLSSNLDLSNHDIMSAFNCDP